MIFLSDLDNTLIFSYKKLSAENICVETKEGKELSYMTPDGAALFEKIVRQCRFIPVTTRSIEQYSRITFPNGYIPEYAICDNGGTLLKNGEPYPPWRSEFEAEFLACREELQRFKDFLKDRTEIFFEIREVDSTFVFTKSRTPEETLSEAEKAVPAVNTVRLNNGCKIYAIPKGISKQRAAIKIRKMLGDDITAAAGDSLFDTDMLGAADIAIVKHGEISQKVINSVQLTELSGDDPDFVLKQVKKILNFKI